MASYAYSAINAQGMELTGEISAPDVAGAREQLRLRGLLAQSLRETAGGESEGSGRSSSLFGPKQHKIKPKSLQVFSRQFATMIEAGLNVVSALVILEEQTDDQVLAAVVQRAPRPTSRRHAALRGDGAAPATSSRASTSPWSRPARRQASSTSCWTASRSRSRRRRRSGAASRARWSIRRGVDLRDARPHRDADVPRPDLRQDLRAARRAAADADADGREGLEPAQEHDWFIMLFRSASGSDLRVEKRKKTEQGRQHLGHSSSCVCR